MKTSTATLVLMVVVCFAFMADQASGRATGNIEKFYLRRYVEEVLVS